MPSADAVRATLSKAGHEAHLLDLLEVADFLGARAVRSSSTGGATRASLSFRPPSPPSRAGALRNFRHLSGAGEVCRLHSAAAAAAGGKGSARRAVA